MEVGAQKFVRDIHEVEPTACIEFFSIQYDPNNPDSIFYFHGGANEELGIVNDIIWQGRNYQAIAMESSAFEICANQKMPRPLIRFANVNFYISQILKSFNRLLNARVTRQKVFVKYIDAINFSGGVNPYSVPDPDTGFIKEVFFINRVSSETRFVVEFELTTSLELENVKVPKRQIVSRYCSFIYRGAGCLYEGAPIQNGREEPFTDTTGSDITAAIGPNLGEWNPLATYFVGEYVFRNTRSIKSRGVNPLDITYVQVFFVCRLEHTSSVNTDPFLRTDIWEKDECSRRLSGCRAHFANSLNFGGWLGTANFSSN